MNYALFASMNSSRRHFGQSAGWPVVKLLIVLGMMIVSASAGASENVAPDVLLAGRPAAAIPHPALPPAGNNTLRLQPGALERSIELEARRLTASAADQGQGRTAAAPQRSWAGRHPILLGTLIGLGVGLGDETMQCVAGVHVIPHSGEGLPCDARVAAAVGGLTAGLGAGIGAVVALLSR